MFVLAEERNMGILHFIVLGWPKSSFQFSIRYYRKIQMNIIVFIEPTQFSTLLCFTDTSFYLFIFLTSWRYVATVHPGGVLVTLFK